LFCGDFNSGKELEIDKNTYFIQAGMAAGLKNTVIA